MLREDLELAVEQKNAEEIFEKWKVDKESVLKENNELDTLLDSLMQKFNLLKNKKQEIMLQRQETELAIQSLKHNFEENQTLKEAIMSEYAEQETIFENLMKRVEAEFQSKLSLENEKRKANKVDQLDILITNKEVLLKEDKEIAVKFDAFEKEIDHLHLAKQKLQKQLEDVDWEICLNGNDLDR